MLLEKQDWCLGNLKESTTVYKSIGKWIELLFLEYDSETFAGSVILK